MKILDVKNTVPYPLSTGTHIASYQFLKALALTHEVSFFGLAHSDREEESAGGLKKFCKQVVITSAPNRKSILHKIFYRLLYTMNLLLRGKPFEESYSSPGPWRKAFCEHMRHEHYDLVIAEYWHNAWVFEHLPEGTLGALLIHDAAFVNNERLLEFCGGRVRRLFLAIGSRISRARESAAIRRAPHILALSGEDLVHIERELTPLNGKIAEVLPILFPSREALSGKNGKVQKHHIYFVGSTRRINNLDAVRHFCSDILPRILQMMPEALFHVIGRVPEETKRQFQDVSAVRFLWHEGDISDLIADKGICVVPLRIGSGIKYKVLDAFCLGKPVVTTTVGAEGIAFYGDHSQCVQDDPKAFAREVVRLIQDAAWYDEVRESQLEFIRANTSLETVRERLSEIFEKITGRRQVD